MLTENTLSCFTLEALFDLMILKLNEYQNDESTEADRTLRQLKRHEIELIQQVIDKRKTLSAVQPCPR